MAGMEQQTSICWEVLSGSNFTFLLWQKLLLALHSPSVSVTLTALTVRARGEAEQVLKKENHFPLCVGLLVLD